MATCSGPKQIMSFRVAASLMGIGALVGGSALGWGGAVAGAVAGLFAYSVGVIVTDGNQKREIERYYRDRSSRYGL